MDNPSYDVIDLARAKRDIDHSLHRRSGVASWQQNDCQVEWLKWLSDNRGTVGFLSFLLRRGVISR